MQTSSAVCTAPGCRWSLWQCFETTCTLARWPCPAGSQHPKAPYRRAQALHLPPGSSLCPPPVLASGDTAWILAGSRFPDTLGWRTTWASLPRWELARSWRAVSLLARTPAARQSQRRIPFLHGKARTPPEIRHRYVFKNGFTSQLTFRFQIWFPTWDGFICKKSQLITETHGLTTI